MNVLETKRRHPMQAFSAVCLSALVGVAITCSSAFCGENAAESQGEEKVVVLEPGDTYNNRYVQTMQKEYPESRLRITLRSLWDPSPNKIIHYPHALVPLDEKDRPHGQERIYGVWGRGLLRSIPWDHGVKTGVEKIFVRKKIKAAVPWKDGVVHGEKKTFHDDGSVASVTPYVDGKPDGMSKSFTPDGTVRRESPMKQGKRHGVMKEYWPQNGGVKREVVYDMGKVVGVAKDYYSNGQLKREIPFKNNSMHGVEKQYDADGAVTRVRYWIDGDIVDEATWKAHLAEKKE